MIPDRRTYSAVVRLDVESRPESLTLVRSLLSAVGDALAFDPELLDDVRTAVSEACNNVVLHAYEAGPGPLMISVLAGPAGLHVLVRDSGNGMHKVSSSAERMGVGLAVIGALADRTEFRSNSDGGTDVRMWFINPDADPDAFAFAEIRDWPPPSASLSGEIVVSLSPVSLLSPVLARLTRAAAAQSRFTADGIAEITAVTNAVATYAAEMWVGETVDFSLSTTTRRLELTAGAFGEVVTAGNENDESWTALAYQLEQPALEHHGAHKLLRTVIVDERVNA